MESMQAQSNTGTSATVGKVLQLVLLSILLTILSLLSLHRKQTFRQDLLNQHSDFDYLKSTLPTHVTTRNATSIASPYSTHNASTPKENYNTEGDPSIHRLDIDTKILDNLLNLSDPIERCFPHNSREWLNAGSRRLGNHNETLIDDGFVSESILNVRSLLSDFDSGNVLEHTLCLEESQFLSVKSKAQEMLNPSNQTIRDWSLRLIYVATHIHQHLPAMKEAQVRLKESASCRSEMKSMGIGVFDYECSEANFLVVPLGRLGLGAVMRLGAVNALIAGIASDRTVIFVNNSPVGPDFIQQPWLLASCPRMDMQCFFMPATPCVLSHDQLKNATVLSKGEGRSLFKHGTLPTNLEDERVVILNLILRPQRTPPTFRDNLVKIINSHVIDPLIQENPSDPRIPMLVEAAEHILIEEEIGETYYYFGHVTKHSHSLVLYAMRPNLHYSKRLDHLMEETFPRDFDANVALGLPIRASDKCVEESECLSFDQYMTLMDRTWTKHEKELQFGSNEHSTSASIIVTSEAPEIHAAQLSYQNQSRGKNHSFAFNFINNQFDLRQGTGNPKKMGARIQNSTLDDVMLSAISSLKMQLHARYTVGNCCSNFHLLLFDFLKAGCGAVPDQVAECLQDNEDPTFRLCCQWSKTEECLAKKQPK